MSKITARWPKRQVLSSAAGPIEICQRLQIRRPTEIMSDTAGYSDIVFGLFYLLGYQFSPRLADATGARIWRFDADADYGPLQSMSRQRINAGFIQGHWDDLLRVAASLKQGLVRGFKPQRSLS